MATRIANRFRAAMFVDAENHADLQISLLLRKLDRLHVVEMHAHADWRNRSLDRLAEGLARWGFELHHTVSGRFPGARKDVADSHMARTVWEIVVAHPEIDVVVIVSGDEFFIDTVRKLKELNKRVILASDPCRVNKELWYLADEYLPLGEIGHWLQALHRLEQSSEYLTFRFAVRQLNICPSELSDLIHKQWVIQESVRRPGRGIRPEIRLNRQAYVVQTTLGTVH